MIVEKKKFFIGLSLFAGFVVVLVLLFLPLFEEKNALDHLDSLYNSISKGSAYYIEDLAAEAKEYAGKEIQVTLAFDTAERARTTAPLLIAGGAAAVVDGEKLSVLGDLGGILDRCLGDSDEMFENDGEKVRERYGQDERAALHQWWLSLGELDKDLTRQKRFGQAKFVATVRKKAVECAYNYYGIEPEKISEKFLIVILSLLFYVVYTIWYGFAILYMFEGWGLKLSH